VSGSRSGHRCGGELLSCPGGLRPARRSQRSAHRAGRLPTCPRPAGGVGLPARVGGFSQPAPATTITRWRHGQDRQPSPGGLFWTSSTRPTS